VGIESVEVCTEEIRVEFERIISRSINPLGFNFDEIPTMQGLHGRSKSSRRSSSEVIMKEECMRQNYCQLIISKETTLSRGKQDQETGPQKEVQSPRSFEH
jgi:hypothetical protein